MTSGSFLPFVGTGSKLFDELEITGAEGAYLKTSTGNSILDASAGAAVGNIGWGRSEVASAAAEALQKTTYTLPLFSTPDRKELVDRLVNKWLPKGLEKICFFGSGSEAVDGAIRLARQYQLSKGRKDRWKVIGRDISYNGTSLATLSVGGHDSRRKDFKPLLLDMPHAPQCYCLRCPFGKSYPECKTECASVLEEIIEREGADTIAAFIAEPIVGTSGGALVPPDTYWPEIERICKRHDIVIIADEVLTGFGRTGEKFAVNHWKVDVDILAMGKGLSGGYANISGLATKREITTSIENAGLMPMYHTYGGHPAACAAANAVLKIMEEESLVDRVNSMGGILEEKLSSLLSHDNVAQVRGRGFLYAIEIVKNKETLERFPLEDGITMKLIEACVKKGVFVYMGGTGKERDIIVVAPPFIIEETQMDTIVSTISDSIKSVCSGG